MEYKSKSVSIAFIVEKHGKNIFKLLRIWPKMVAFHRLYALVSVITFSFGYKFTLYTPYTATVAVKMLAKIGR